MLTAALLALVAFQDPTPAYSGRAGRINVTVPRLDSTVAVDGVLSEAAWGAAARLTDFSQYQPVDGRPAEEPTEVLVWYASDAIYFGIRARELHGEVVRATRANRDNIGSEDQIQILLDTYNDRRIAFLFGVNPLGVQQDGTRSDQFGGGAGGRSATGGGTGNMNPLEGSVDLNPDFVFESKGRLVPGGYEVEVRIPFKSLRYGEGRTQTWGINVLRRVQHTGFQDSWAPAVRASASFLGQSGTLVGLTDLRRGLVLDVTPTATGRLDGSRGPGGWRYDEVTDLGADVRWGISQNLVMNGTVNPDFSQIEADVGQVLLNERFALFYPEKRPFFLDGLEAFDTPSQLIYTRRIVAPDAGVKLAGKVGRVNVGFLGALDDRSQSWSGTGRPTFGIARLRTDLGRNSTLGGVLTTREDGPDHSRLAGVDVRLYHSRLYFVELQAVQVWTDSAGRRRSGPLWHAQWDRTGRNWGFNYTLEATAPGFDAAAGFVNRTGVIVARAFNRVSGYGAPGALVETYGAFVGFNRLWGYDDPGAGTVEGGESISPSATLRGGWQIGGNLSRNYFVFRPADYAGLSVALPGGGTAGFEPPDATGSLWSGSLRVTTPTFRHFTFSASAGLGQPPIFREASPGRSLSLNAAVDVRPTGALRGTFQISRFTLDRRRDGSRFSTETIPRLKVEYQLHRSIFVRFVGQYTARSRAPLLDPEGHPVLVGGVLDTGERTNEFRMDWLFSYRPTPGTLVYLGYGSTSNEPQQFRFSDLRRAADGFFGKVSYVFRL